MWCCTSYLIERTLPHVIFLDASVMPALKVMVILATTSTSVPTILACARTANVSIIQVPLGASVRWALCSRRKATSNRAWVSKRDFGDCFWTNKCFIHVIFYAVR